LFWQFCMFSKIIVSVYRTQSKAPKLLEKLRRKLTDFHQSCEHLPTIQVIFIDRFYLFVKKISLLIHLNNRQAKNFFQFSDAEPENKSFLSEKVRKISILVNTTKRRTPNSH
jgi:hypothetical protein